MFGRGRIDALEREVMQLRVQLTELQLEAKQRTPAALQASVNDVTQAIETLAAANRREFGKLWKTYGNKLGRAPRDDDDGVDDPEFAAIMALQRAHGGT